MSDPILHLLADPESTRGTKASPASGATDLPSAASSALLAVMQSEFSRSHAQLADEIQRHRAALRLSVEFAAALAVALLHLLWSAGAIVGLLR